MKSRRAIVALLAAAAAGCGLAAAQETAAPELTWTVKPVRAEIGDRVRVDLDVVVPAGLAVGAPLFPSWSDTWGDVEVVQAEDPVAEPASAGATRFRQTLFVTPWKTGELNLPSPIVEIPTATEILKISASKPIVLTIGSVLPEGEERPAPRPPAPPQPLPVSEIFWWTLGIGAGACLLAAALVVLRRRAAVAAARPAVVDPLTAFRNALAALETGDDPLSLIAGLSLALRRYLGGRLDFGAAESTTTEIRRRLQDGALPAGLVTRIDRLLKHCDAIKFARRPIERDACAEPLAEAARIADALEALLVPPPTEESEPETGREAA